MSDLTTEQDAVAAAQEAFDKAQAVMADAKAALDNARRELDEAVAAATPVPHVHQDQIDRMAYIQAQAEQRAARHGIAVQLREGAPDPDVLDPRSQLDKAMTRQTKRGTKRPEVKA